MAIEDVEAPMADAADGKAGTRATTEAPSRAPRGYETLYADAFARYLSSGTEGALHTAYELGRKAIDSGVSLLDLTVIHHQTLAQALNVTPPTQTGKIIDAAADYSLQVFSAFEMVYRGFWEAQEILQVEKHHAEQLHRLADIFVEISSAGSVSDVLETAVDKARRLLACRCCLAAVFFESHPIAATSSSDDETAALWKEWARGDNLRTLQAVAAKVPRVAALETSSQVSMVWPEPTHPSHTSSLCLIAPFMGANSVCNGFLVLMEPEEGAFSRKDEAILIQLSRIVSTTLDNVRLYERERRVAETLQRALLPKKLPDLPGIAAAARYRPGAVGVNVGGDWFDVISLADHQTGVAVGDVVGRGVRAASVMGQVRTAFRAIVLDDSAPTSVLSRLNQLIPTLESDHFSTMVYVLWDPAQRVLHMGNAGHPPPLLVQPDGRSTFLEQALHPPLGVLEDARYEAAEFRLSRGSTVLLYTDGLVEQGGLDRGFRLLERAASRRNDDLEAFCDQVLEAMLPSETVDDVALLALRFA
jgi:GAF domain-containing protein